MFLQKQLISVPNVLDWGDINGKISSKDKKSYA